MAIINSGVSQGAELRPTGAGPLFIADRSVVAVGGFHITSRLMIGAVAGLILGALWKS